MLSDNGIHVRKRDPVRRGDESVLESIMVVAINPMQAPDADGN